MYTTPQQLLDMEEKHPEELERRFKQALDSFHEAGHLRSSDLQLPIMRGPPPTCKQFLQGYEGDSFDPVKLGVACVVVPPSEGRGANAKGSAWNLNPASTPPLTTPLPSKPPSRPAESLSGGIPLGVSELPSNVARTAGLPTRRRPPSLGS